MKPYKVKSEVCRNNLKPIYPFHLPKLPFLIAFHKKSSNLFQHRLENLIKKYKNFAKILVQPTTIREMKIPHKQWS